MRLIISLLLVAAPFLTQAQAHKCKQPNGSVSFQDQPCPPGTAASAVTLAPPGPQPAPPQNARQAAGRRDPRQLPERSAQDLRADQEVAEANQRARAFNQMQRCNHARQQLGVLKESRRVFRRDDKGDRQYVSDENRASEVAAAEQRVGAECN